MAKNPTPSPGDIWRDDEARETFRVETVDKKLRIKGVVGHAVGTWLTKRTKAGVRAKGGEGASRGVVPLSLMATKRFRRIAGGAVPR